MKIDLKDGYCVSCGRESGVLYRSCPYCGERVWHPLWRRVSRSFILFALPLLLLAAILAHLARWSPLWKTCCNGAWPWQSFLAVSTGLLLMPRHDQRLILSSSKGQAWWLANSLAASILLLLCAAVAATALRSSTSLCALEWLLAVACGASALLIPFVLNSGWWRVALAGLIALSLLLV